MITHSPKLIKDSQNQITSYILSGKSKTSGIREPDVYEAYQIILSDTPGHVESSYLLHDKMNRNIFSSLDGSDIIIYVTDVNEKLINKKLINSVRSLDIPIF